MFIIIQIFSIIFLKLIMLYFITTYLTVNYD